MSDEQTLLKERLETVLEALERIPRRFSSVSKPADFIKSETGKDTMDAICMVLIAAGEEFKQIDRQTKGDLFSQYPQIPWRKAIGLRDVLAHGYFQADPVQLYSICKENIPSVIETLQKIIKDLS